MDWQDILKSEEEYEELIEQLVTNVHFFDPSVDIDTIKAPYMSSSGRGMRKLKAAVRSFEFMRPVKDDIEIIGGGDRVKYRFYLYGDVTLTLYQRLRSIGSHSHDNYIIVGKNNINNSEVCVKAGGIMTNGDFITTLVLAVKNNAVPNILKLIAYSKHKELKIFQSVIHNTNELSYKQKMIRVLQESSPEDYEIDIQGLSQYDANHWLITLGVPIEVLGSW